MSYALRVTPKIMKIIAGLGNPGEKYQKTRHNAGFLALDELANRRGLSWSLSKKCQAQLARDHELILVKPLAFMNNSGAAVRAVLSYYRLLPKKLGLFAAKNADLSEALLVVHDDIDLPLEKYRISTGSGSAGHKGVESVIGHCRTKNFTRLRLGIRPEAEVKIPTDKFVLQKFAPAELVRLRTAIMKALAEKILAL